MPKTKQCEVCDTTIAESETKCPSCGADLEELEETVKAVENANKVLEKRKAKEAPPKNKETEAPVKESAFARLRRLRGK